MRLLAPQLEGLPRRSRGKYGKRKHLSPEEKAELTRRRNRENARSTRMRRKMYIKHLQQVAETLKERHDELNSKITAPPPDGYTRRRDAVRRFFGFRGDGIFAPDGGESALEKPMQDAIQLIELVGIDVEGEGEALRKGEAALAGLGRPVAGHRRRGQVEE